MHGKSARAPVSPGVGRIFDTDKSYMKDKLKVNRENQQNRIRLLLETLVRAAIQGIPFVGSSIDQLTYGYRDSVEIDKIKSTIDDLQTKVNSFLEKKECVVLDDVYNGLGFSDQ